MLTEEKIKEINNNCPGDQGIYFNPSGVPVNVKELVIYSRWRSHGYSGGNCYGNSSSYYEEDRPDDYLKVLDLVVEQLCPNIKYSEFKEIEKLIHTNSETEHEYYGNYNEWEIIYIKLSDLYNLLNKLDYVN